MSPVLNGCTILVTRPRAQGENLCRLIDAAGGISVLLPALEIQPVSPAPPGELTVKLAGADDVVFVSRNAVICLQEQTNDIAADLKAARIFAVGEGTMQELRVAGIRNVIVPLAESSSEGLLALDEFQSGRIANRRVLIVRGVGGREILGETLQARGAQVQYIDIYRRVCPDLPPEVMRKLWLEQRPDIVVVTSRQGLDNLIRMTAETERGRLLASRLVVISPRLARIASAAGFVRQPTIAVQQSDQGLLQAIAETVERMRNEC